MAVISMELTILGSIPLGIWVVVLPGPSDCVAHVLHDSHALYELNVKIVLRNPSAIFPVRMSAHLTAWVAYRADDVDHVRIHDVERQRMAWSSAMWVACRVLRRVT